MSNTKKHKDKGKFNNGLLDCRIGQKHVTKQGYEIELIEYIGANNCTILFNDGTILKNRSYSEILRKSIKNPNHKTTYNLGFIGQGVYDTTSHNGLVYKTWSSIFQRCYSGIKHVYKDVTVCEEWHNFQNFAEWFYKNYNPEYMNGWHLDKDILCKECKIYSPETCCFVPQEINIVILSYYTKNGVLPQGVRYKYSKFESNITINKVNKYLGIFNTSEEAFEVYKQAKEAYIKELAKKWKDKIDSKVYDALIMHTLL